jgi:hypothetical protein
MLTMNFDDLYNRHAASLDDFWSRRTSAPAHVREFAVCGRRVRLAANHAGVLAAADLAAPLYSTAPEVAEPPFDVQFIVQPAPAAPPPAPDDLVRHVLYAGDGDRLALQAGAWGHAQIDRPTARALAVLTPEWAARPDLVAQCLLHTILLNLLIARGLGLLHATCVVQGGHALLLLAPHNVGKSTTALRLALAGYPLMTDSMVYVEPRPQGLRLLGYPVGRVKLRADVLDEFPQLRARLTAEQIRDETKFVVDLQALDPALVCAAAVEPARVSVCLLDRADRDETRVEPLGTDELWDAVMINSLYADTRDVWRRNLEALAPLVARAQAHRLVLGWEPAGVVATVAKVMG